MFAFSIVGIAALCPLVSARFSFPIGNNYQNPQLNAPATISNQNTQSNTPSTNSYQNPQPNTPATNSNQHTLSNIPGTNSYQNTQLGTGANSYQNTQLGSNIYQNTQINTPNTNNYQNTGGTNSYQNTGGTSSYQSQTSGSSGGFSFPLSNGFPNIPPGSPKETDIFQQAHGPVPRSNLPPLKPDDVTSIRFLAFNEIFEVAYFTEFLDNVTNNVPGYVILDPYSRNFTITTLTAIRAQEEVHALQANDILIKMDLEPIQACRYRAPVSDLRAAFAYANTFTDLVIATIQDVATRLGRNNDSEYIASIIGRVGNEAEQDGYFRTVQHKIPAPTPLLTRGSRVYTYSYLNQNVVVPGSCPNSYLIDLQILPSLNAVQQPDPNSSQNQTIQFYVPVTETTRELGAENRIVYIEQQNQPVVVPIRNVRQESGSVYFEAEFPTILLQYGGYGLIIAALTNDTGPFQTIDDVVPFTIAGPYLYDVK
ncbi:uncharacterized protein [Bemisia tabaci]|uniref:uncharacterized protein n=1 Tax=Bemisia tabaci TaxID=7038 RepID=UPI003B28ABC4